MNKARKIADMAIFTAIGVVLNIMSFSSYGFFGRMSLVYAYCYIVGILYGPLLGASIAILADLIPALVLPQGPFNIFLNLGTGLMAFIVGFCVHYKKREWKIHFNARFAIGIILSFLLVTLGINAYGETMMFNIYPYTFAKTMGASLGITSPYLMLVLAKAIQQPFWVIMNTAIVYIVVYRLRNLISFRYGLNFFESKKSIEIEE